MMDIYYEDRISRGWVIGTPELASSEIHRDQDGNRVSMFDPVREEKLQDMWKGKSGVHVDAVVVEKHPGLITWVNIEEEYKKELVKRFLVKETDGVEELIPIPEHITVLPMGVDRIERYDLESNTTNLVYYDAELSVKEGWG